MRLFFSFLIILFSCTVAADNIPGGKQPAPVQGRLENGLRYTVLPRHEQKNRVDVIVRVYAGALDETETQSGVAHMVEHLAFRASADYPDGVMPYLHAKGWLRGRNYNAYTNHDHTTYIYMPPQNFSLEQTLGIVREMLFNAKIRPQDWEDERKIVLEEWRTRDGVRRRLWEQQMNSGRVNSRYADRPVIGTEHSITTMPVQELQRFYQTWYTPGNMQLLLVGDIQPQNAEKMIRTFFAGLPHREIPARDYYEPVLENKLRVDRLGDPQNNRSQVAYLFRFDDSVSQAQSEAGFYHRLIDTLALNFINQRFRDEKALLPENINTLTARKHLAGKTTGILTFSATVEKRSHHQGLQHIIREIERFRRYPVTQAELDQQKRKIRDQLNNDRDTEKHYGFDDWVQTMISTVLNDKIYYSQAQTEQMTEAGLEKITLAEVKRRIDDWLNSGDRIVQYMPPLTINIEPVTTAMITDWQQSAAENALKMPDYGQRDDMRLPALDIRGEITQEQRFPAQNVVRWTLSNGDTVVWLKSAVAKNKTYLHTQSDAGSNSPLIESWKGKFAVQMIGLNAPLDWTRNQMLEWKERNGIPLIMRQGFTKLNMLSTVENNKLADLLRFYHANQSETRIKEEFDKSKTNFIRQIELNRDAIDFKRNLAWETFVYGRAINPQPDVQTVEKITESELMAQWKRITSQPVTYFILNDMDEAEVRTLVLRNLAVIPRGTATKTPPLSVLKGTARQTFAMNPEPKDNIYLSLLSPHHWSAKAHLTAELLSTIAAEKLSLRMRDKTLGVYGIRFHSRLSEETRHLHSTLTFTANPDMTDKLLDLAKQELADLPQTISREDLDKVKAYFRQNQENQRNTPDFWLERLIFGEVHFGNPDYLQQADEIVAEINLTDVRAMAKEMFNRENQRLFVTTPESKK